MSDEEEEESWEIVPEERKHDSQPDKLDSFIVDQESLQYVEIEVKNLFQEKDSTSQSLSRNNSSGRLVKAQLTKLRNWFILNFYRVYLMSELSSVFRLYQMNQGGPIIAYFLSKLPPALISMRSNPWLFGKSLVPWWKRYFKKSKEFEKLANYFKRIDWPIPGLSSIWSDNNILFSALSFYAICVQLEVPVRLITAVAPISELFPKTSTENKLQGPAKRKRVSDPEVSPEKRPKYWIEIYDVHDKRWKSADLIRGYLDEPQLMDGPVGPIACVIAFGDGYVKDVSRRYCASCVERASRMSRFHECIESTLSFFNRKLLLSKDLISIEDETEDQEFRTKELEEMTPSTINQYKNHKLYALERHLKKYEVIYPKDEGILGWIHDEAIYPRSSIKRVKSQEAWFQEAMVIPPNVEPAKIIQGKKQNATQLGSPNSQSSGKSSIPLYGSWQVVYYDPPSSNNGIVPKNEFNNVHLFHPRMLPKGCVHLTQYDGIKSIAKKLSIDFADAVVGFDFHGGRARPRVDGIIICCENEDLLLNAYQQHLQELKQRELLAKKSTLIKKWKLLIKKAVIVFDFLEKYKDDLHPVVD